MAQILNLNNTLHSGAGHEVHGVRLSSTSRILNDDNQQWNSLQQKIKCNGRVSCLFSDNRREEQARKALENALGGKKNEFEKWNKEIKKREEVGGGDAGGGGGWFGWGRRFGWSNGDHFWQEAQQTLLTVLGILVMYLILAKGELLLAVVINPLLYALRGIRNSFSVIASSFQRKSSLDTPAPFAEAHASVSAKESVLRKWGNA